MTVIYLLSIDFQILDAPIGRRPSSLVMHQAQTHALLAGVPR